MGNFWMTDVRNLPVLTTACLQLIDGTTLSGATKVGATSWEWRDTIVDEIEIKGYLPHSAAIVDNTAVEALAQHMRGKLTAARLKGRGGWQNCEPQVLSDMLHEHVTKGDPVDVANFCAFLSTLGSPILPRSQGHATEPTPA